MDESKNKLQLMRMNWNPQGQIGTHVCLSLPPISTLAMQLFPHGPGHEEAEVGDLAGA